MPTQVSAGCIAFMMSFEGWTDGRKPGNKGEHGTDAQAVNQSIDKKSVITVGPGITNGSTVGQKWGITAGKVFTGEQLFTMYKQQLEAEIKEVLRYNPLIGQLSLNVFDMAVECMHGGLKFWLNAGWGKVTNAQEAATACSRLPVTSKGKVLPGLLSRRRCESAICLGLRSNTNDDETRRCNQYYSPSGKIGELAKKICGNNSSGTEQTNNTDTQSTQTNTPLKEIVDPNKDAGNVFENSYANAYSNILGVNGNLNIRKVKHTRIYALFNSTIVLDSLSELIDQANQEAEFEADKIIAEEQLKAAAAQNKSQVESSVDVSTNNVSTEETSSLPENETTPETSENNSEYEFLPWWAGASDIVDSITETMHDTAFTEIASSEDEEINEEEVEEHLAYLKGKMDEQYKKWVSTNDEADFALYKLLKLQYEQELKSFSVS